MPDIEDYDCLSCRVIGSVIPIALSGYVVHTWWKKVAPTGKLLSTAVYISFAGGRS
jgi:glucose-6-phosphate dehydrogenase assembly protein OpcA